MKTLLIITALMLLSCKKNHTCECRLVTEETTITVEYYIKNGIKEEVIKTEISRDTTITITQIEATENKAYQKCQAKNYSVKEGNTNETQTCKLK